MNRLSLIFQKFELAIQTIFGRGFPSGNWKLTLKYS